MIPTIILITFALLAVGAAFYFEKGWRTIIANVVAGLPLAWDAIDQLLSTFVGAANQYSLSSYIPPQYMWIYGLGMALLNIGLRMVTSSPVGKSL
jgi:hypothetical protein